MQRLGRQPTVDELADHLAVRPDEVLEALDAGASYRPAPLSPPGDQDDRAADEAPALGIEDADLSRADVRLAVRRILATLPPRERTIVYLRYFRGLTQQEIADRVGTSQVHVSRLLRASLERLKGELTEDSPSF